MQTVAKLMRQRAEELLTEGQVDQVLGWKAGDLLYDSSPAFFTTKEQLVDLIYDQFCAANLSKYLVQNDATSDKTLVFLKPCDTYSFNQLLSERRVVREQVYIVGIPCGGLLDMRKTKEKDVLLEKCLCCKGDKHVVFDELLGEPMVSPASHTDRFSHVKELEEKTPEERFVFWQKELSKCIRCNACRNVCPACTCIQCVFDNSRSGVSSKASANDFEDSMFHIIRAYHVAGRCTDCGECSRVCPQEIPLHLLNRKFIKDINILYGDYQAGAEAEMLSPLTDYAKEDAEPGIVSMLGGIR